MSENVSESAYRPDPEPQVPLQGDSSSMLQTHSSSEQLQTALQNIVDLDAHFITIQEWTTLSALLTNAYLLGISCSTRAGLGFHIRETITPPSLAPLPLQNILPHFPYIDLIPVPSMRTSLLGYFQSIDSTEIWFDLLEGGFRIWGAIPWEEEA